MDLWSTCAFEHLCNLYIRSSTQKLGRSCVYFQYPSIPIGDKKWIMRILYPTYPSTKSSGKFIENKMRISFWHSSYVRYVMSHNNIRQCEVGCGTIRQMTYNYTIWKQTESIISLECSINLYALFFTTSYITYHTIWKMINHKLSPL